jgi:hypothetical protein
MAPTDLESDEVGDDLSKKELDDLLKRGEPEAAGIIHGAIEDFSQELALVVRRYLKLKGWKGPRRRAGDRPHLHHSQG